MHGKDFRANKKEQLKGICAMLDANAWKKAKWQDYCGHQTVTEKQKKNADRM